MDTSNRSTKIHVSELRVGMFVSKLDRDWLETPFLVQGFMIETPEEAQTVAEHAEYVWIDAVQSKWVPPEHRSFVEVPAPAKKTYINKVSARKEHGHAIKVFRDARRLTKTLVDDIRLGGTIDTEQAKVTVRGCVDSILRNPDALLWMTKIRDEDEYTAEHCLNVCILAIAFGRHLGMSENELEKIGLCGLLHDVGKMRVPPEVLNKPGPLTPKEFNMIRAHTVLGRNLLLSTPGIFDAVVDVAYSHHERMDGMGYPRKLPQERISYYARVIALVDAYDAMTANRCYAPAIPTTQALKNIYKDRGTHFDEKLALEFIKSIGLYPPGTVVQLHNDMVGIVLEISQKYRHLPKVILIKKGEVPLEKEQVVNLADVEKGLLAREFLIKRALKDGTYGIRVAEYREKGLVFRAAVP
ncbi:HD-GYP domain-containing protein [Marinimicrobium agarilyticum]|uniref:HD-GYP domain-containing protein n=1 Tax=Marinimicrobium agarilyticum TaxID=306546 RepID=UPI000484A62E|nr:HD-GYP domain-containing protein [Marinimicrobium agarilyticum]